MVIMSTNQLVCILLTFPDEDEDRCVNFLLSYILLGGFIEKHHPSFLIIIPNFVSIMTHSLWDKVSLMIWGCSCLPNNIHSNSCCNVFAALIQLSLSDGHFSLPTDRLLINLLQNKSISWGSRLKCSEVSFFLACSEANQYVNNLWFWKFSHLEIVEGS